MFKKTIDNKIFFSSFLVLLLAELANTITCLIDGILTGKFLGQDAMAAYGLANPYFSIAAIISGMLMVSLQTLCTKALSKGDKEKANEIFSTTIFFALVFSFLLTALIWIFPNKICVLLGAKGESSYLLSGTKDYLIGLGSSAPLMVLIAVLIPIMQLDGAGNKAKISSLVLAITDIVGDLLNVLVFKKGLLGMGIASSLSYVTGLLVILSHFLSKKSTFKFSFKNVKIKDSKHILLDGIPRGIMRLCEGLGPIFLNTMVVGFMGVLGVGALSIQRNISFIANTVGWGIAGAAMQCSALYYAEHDEEGIKRMMNNAHKYNLIFVSLLSLLIFVFAPQIAKLYMNDVTDLLSIAIVAIRAHAIRLMFITFNFTIANYAQVIGRQGMSFFGNIASGFAYLIPLAFILGESNLDLGFWISFPLSEAFVSITLLVLIAVFGKGKSNRLLMLKDSFVNQDVKRYAVTISSIDSAINLSKDIQEFIINSGGDSKKAYKVALSIEEMACVTIEKGFNDGKTHMIDIRVSITDGSLIIRFRDDCELYDISKKIEDWEMKEDDPMDNIGIRLVMGISKEVNYTNMMGTNNLIVVI